MPEWLRAKHIIGGEITYECLSSGQYEFTMRVYRDCAGSGAAFDDPAIITIFRQNGNSYDQFGDPLRIDIAGVPFDVPAEEMPCMDIPANICVEQANYIWTQNLPVIDESYYVVYQRCCRNNTITNIIDPNSTGATYFVELLPAAQQVCNNSPTYNDFPPIVICANQSIDFDHSATDADGDQLVYEFCSPKDGGGLGGSAEGPPGSSASACDGVAPNPGCPPPFNNVLFALPDFSPLQPMAGDPIVSINSSTGFISGNPEFIGQYVVGVCVKEYRNGVLLSEVRRDFQFNVTDCQPFVLPVIEDLPLVNDTFYVVSCGDNSVFLENNSTQVSNIETFGWDFDILNDGNLVPFSEWSPTIDFPLGVGSYNGKLYLNPGEACGDTADIVVQIFPGLEADFDLAYDTCVAGPVDFTDLSFTNADSIVNWSWDFGEGGTSSEINPSYDYLVPGDHLVSLVIEDNNGCQDTFTQLISYFPVPALVVVEPTELLGCAPQQVTINNLSYPIDSTYTILWDLGDGNTSTAVSPVHVYQNPGLYDVSVDITSPIGCETDAAWNNLIRIRPTPQAGFSFTPASVSNFNSEVSFLDESVDAGFWTWEFGEDGFAYIPNPVYVFPDTGLQQIVQIVEHPEGCRDTMIQYIDVVPEFRYFIPNAFTPNLDGLNDLFYGVGFFENISSFRMVILNRWGELIFETNSPDEGWNGQKYNTGKPSPGGVYIYKVKLTGARGEVVELDGFVTLVR